MKLIKIQILILLFLSASVYAQNTIKKTKSFNENELIIVLKESYTLDEFYLSLNNYFNKTNLFANKKIDISNFALNKSFKMLKTNKNKIHSKKNILVLQSQSLTSDQLKKLVRNFPSVESTEKNYEISVKTTPNDSDFSQQWGLEKIEAPQAWEKTTGSQDVVVGLIDTGIDYTHEDLKNNVWINEVERNGYAGVDDDGNGYVDDIYGIDTAYGDSDPKDSWYIPHGTHCAGIMGGVGNNGIGIAGVNWDVKIATCKFLNFFGSGSTADAVECVNYFNTLKENGVNIVATNNSWGGEGTDDGVLKDAFNSAKDLGIISVAAAGNSAKSNDIYNFVPANIDIDSLITVGASDQNDNLASFSNYGKSVDIAAPGVDIYSSVYGNGYDAWDGTSMATPFVTGAIAIISAMHPEYTYKQKIDAIYNSADKITQLTSKIDQERRLNLNNLVTQYDQDDGSDNSQGDTDDGTNDGSDDGSDNGTDDGSDDDNPSTPTSGEKIFPNGEYITLDGIDFKEFDTSLNTLTEITANLNGVFFSTDVDANIDITSNNSFNAYGKVWGFITLIVKCEITDGKLKTQGAYYGIGNYSRDMQTYATSLATDSQNGAVGIHSVSIYYK